MRQRTVLRLVAAGAGIAAVVLLPLGLWDALWAWRSAGWPTAAAEFSAFEYTNRKGRSHGKSGGGASVSAAYHYEVDGVRRHGTRVVFGYAKYIDKARKSDLVSAIAAKTTYPIAYAPGNPARSVVFPGWNPGGLITAGIGLMLGILGLGILVGTRVRSD